jgi:hypothetical protein
MADVQCPFCGQDYVTRIYIHKLEREVFTCWECGKLWLEARDVGSERWGTYHEFMRCFGRDPDDPNEYDERGYLQVLVG